MGLIGMDAERLVEVDQRTSNESGKMPWYVAMGTRKIAFVCRVPAFIALQWPMICNWNGQSSPSFCAILMNQPVLSCPSK
jgi:hypothetical protein